MKELTKKRISAPIFSVLPMGISYVLMLLISITVTIIGLCLNISEEEITDSQLYGYVLTYSGMFAGALIGCVILKKRNGTRLKEVIRIKNFDFAVPIMLLLGLWAASELLDHFDGLLLSQFMTVESDSESDEVLTLINVIGAVVLAPITEEILIRYLGSEFPRGAYSMPVICIASGLFFAFLHMYNIQGFFNVFVGGVAASYVYCKTRNILYIMLEHAIHNALCCIDLGDWFYYEKNGFVLATSQWLAVNAVVLAIVLIYYFKVFRKKYTENYFEVNRENGLPNSTEADEIAA